MDIFCQEIVQRLRTTTSHGADNFLRQFYIILYNVWAYHIWNFWYVRTKFKIFPLVFEPLHDAFYGHHYDSLVFKVCNTNLHYVHLRILLCRDVMSNRLYEDFLPVQIDKEMHWKNDWMRSHFCWVMLHAHFVCPFWALPLKYGFGAI